MDKSKIFYIRAKRKRDYVYDGIRDAGFSICIPYRDRNLLLRCLREAWFRLHLPCRSIWYNPALRDIRAKTIILNDPLITPDLLRWLRERYPDRRIILDYENRAAATISPELAKPYITEGWTYDLDDAERYGLRYRTYPLDAPRPGVKQQPEFDVVFVGKDKGRAERLFALQREFEAQGLRTYFHICPDRSFLRFKKPYYKPYIDYEDYLSLFGRSRAILNLMPEGQRSVTQRDFESCIYGIKCITNSAFIRETELYDPSRFFILGVDHTEDLKAFLETPFAPLDESLIRAHDGDAILSALLGEG